MAVTEDARGKGVGTLLLQTALDEVERRGIAGVRSVLTRITKRFAYISG